MATQDFMSMMRDKTASLKPSLLSAEEDIKQQIVMLDELRDLIPPLTDDELRQLEQNVLRYGVKDPLTIWETTTSIAGIDEADTPAFVLIDGHNRYRLIQLHALDFRINLVQFPSLDAVKDYMIKYQLGRRNLSAEQASYLRGMRYLGQKSLKGSNLNATGPTANVADALAKEYGVSDRTIKRDGDYAAGIEKLTPELKRDVLAGKRKLTKTTINTLGKSAITDLIDASTLQATPPAETSPAGGRITDPVASVLILKGEIRDLANGRLNGRECAKLIKKLTELINLQSPK